LDEALRILLIENFLMPLPAEPSVY
jgi:hypothetical protein